MQKLHADMHYGFLRKKSQRSRFLLAGFQEYPVEARDRQFPVRNKLVSITQHVTSFSGLD